MKKQLLLIVMLLSAAASTFAVEAEIDGLWYELVAKAKMAKVIQNKDDVSYNGDIVIPETVVYEGVTCSVMSIKDYAFQGCSGLISVTIPNSVTSIGNYTFSNCSGLISVTIPNSVTSIGECAFGDCSGLISVTIPNSVTSIGECAFGGCSSLTSITIPNSVTSIGGGAFQNCSGLTSVTIPNSVTSIGNYTFSNCSGLISVTIPNSVTSIGNYTFSNCSGLISVTIPNSVTSIGENAFSGCSGLTSVIIGGDVKTISSQPFANCPELTDVTCYAENVPWTGNNAFEGSYIEYVTLHVPTASISLYESAEPWKKFMKIVNLDVPKHYLRYIVDGEEYMVYEIEEGVSISPENNPIKEGYSFSGWSEVPETMPDHDVTVNGSFTINKYKLTYTVDGEEYKSSEVEYGSAITAEAEPTKEGYTFSGWSEIPETMPANDVTITGTFTINKYRIIYEVDGSEYKIYRYEYGATIVPEVPPTKEGYTFSGWSEIPETMPAEDVTVTGTFTINKYKVTYMIDGEVYKTEEVEYGATITPPNPEDRSGYDFTWGDYPSMMPAKDITITGSYTVGIKAILATESDVKIYTVSGKPIKKLQKGVNIIRTRDGKTKKVMVK